MTWTFGVPADGQSLGNSKLEIRNNFNLTYNTFNQNHYPPTDPLQGKHKFVVLPTTTIPTTAVNEFAVYSKTVNTISQLFYTSDNSTNEIQVTAGNTTGVNFATLGTNTNYANTSGGKPISGGWTYLPGGLIMFYGSINTNPLVTDTVPYPFQFPSGNPAYSITLTWLNGSVNGSYTVISNLSTTFSYTLNAAPLDLFFMAIGK